MLFDWRPLCRCWARTEAANQGGAQEDSRPVPRAAQWREFGFQPEIHEQPGGSRRESGQEGSDSIDTNVGFVPAHIVGARSASEVMLIVVDAAGGGGATMSGTPTLRIRGSPEVEEEEVLRTVIVRDPNCGGPRIRASVHERAFASLDSVNILDTVASEHDLVQTFSGRRGPAQEVGGKDHVFPAHGWSCSQKVPVVQRRVRHGQSPGGVANRVMETSSLCLVFMGELSAAPQALKVRRWLTISTPRELTDLASQRYFTVRLTSTSLVSLPVLSLSIDSRQDEETT